MESWEAIAISQALRLGQFWHACNMPLTAHRYVNVKPLKIGINWRKFVPFHPLDLQKTDFCLSVASAMLPRVDLSGDSWMLKSDEFSSVFSRPLSFGDGRRPIAL